MINENCNQKCPYCFASEFVNIRKNNITFENFVKATKFILTEKDDKRFGRIGIIGGEPLLHPQFDDFVNYLVNKDEINRITIYTNGVLLEEHLDVILNDKVGLLININSPDDVGSVNFDKTQKAIDLLVNKYEKRNRLTIGLNIYDNIDYSFFVDIAEKFEIPRVRLSIVVPAYGKKKKGFEHFISLKNKVLEITKALLLRDIKFGFDCNWPVQCMWTTEEIEDLRLMGLCSDSRDLIPLNHSCCRPVIDILPDLMAIRCFGLSDKTKMPIDQFCTISDLRQYYMKNIDSVLAENPLLDKCNECHLFMNTCYGGCLANRIN